MDEAAGGELGARAPSWVTPAPLNAAFLYSYSKEARELQPPASWVRISALQP